MVDLTAALTTSGLLLEVGVDARVVLGGFEAGGVG